MKLRGMIACASILTSLVAGVALSEENAVTATVAAPMTSANFNNHLHSNVMVSPAQLYQVTAGKTDVSINFDMTNSETKSSAAKTESEGTGTTLMVTGIYSVPNVPFKAGLDLNYAMGSADAKNNGTKVAESDSSTTTFAPVFVYSVADMIHVGAKYAITTDSSKTKGAETQDVNYGIFTPGVTVAQTGWEAGIVYNTAVDEEAKKATELDAYVPSAMAVHGRYAVMPELALGGMITQKNWNAINDNMKNQTLVNANAEWTMNQLKVEGTLGWAGEIGRAHV